MRRPTLPWLFWAFSSSLVLHGVAYASLGLSPRSTHERPGPSEVSFEMSPLPEPPPPTPPPPAAPEPPAPEPRAAPPIQSRVAPAPPPLATAKAEPPPAAAPLDLSGVTLTNAGDNAFSMPVGNGQAFAGVIGPGGSRSAPRAEPSAPPAPAARGPEIVPLSDLSARPVPPALDGALRRNYPEEARRRAIGGSASIRARLDPDGVLRRVQVQSETFAGFGNACRRTLEGSTWSAPRDRSGRAVATEIRYTCRFQVDP